MAEERHGVGRPPSGMSEGAIARSIAINHAYFRTLELEDAVHRGTRRWSLDEKQDLFLRRLHSAKPKRRMLLANKHVRQAAVTAVVDALLTDFFDDPNRKRYFLTFCWDAGLTWERRPYINLVTLKNMVNQRLRRLGLHGIGVVEIDILNNLTGEPGRRVLAHVHCYCWPVGSGFKPHSVARKLSKRATLHNDLGARSLVIKCVGLSEISIARLAGYLLKPPSRGKNRVPRRREVGKYAMRDTELEGSSATRLIEILSHIEFRDVLFGVGEGCELTRRIRHNFAKRTARWRGRKWEVPDAKTVAQHWIAIRTGNGSRHFRPPIVITKVSQRHEHQRLEP